jgi:hypothetical protein
MFRDRSVSLGDFFFAKGCGRGRILFIDQRPSFMKWKRESRGCCGDLKSEKIFVLINLLS